MFADSFKEMGGEIVAFEAVGKGDTDMRPVLKIVAEAGPPEFIYYPIFIAEGAAITTQAREVAGLERRHSVRCRRHAVALLPGGRWRGRPRACTSPDRT